MKKRTIKLLAIIIAMVMLFATSAWVGCNDDNTKELQLLQQQIELLQQQVLYLQNANNNANAALLQEIEYLQQLLEQRQYICYHNTVALSTRITQLQAQLYLLTNNSNNTQNELLAQIEDLQTQIALLKRQLNNQGILTFNFWVYRFSSYIHGMSNVETIKSYCGLQYFYFLQDRYTNDFFTTHYLVIVRTLSNATDSVDVLNITQDGIIYFQLIRQVVTLPMTISQHIIIELPRTFTPDSFRLNRNGYLL